MLMGDMLCMKLFEAGVQPGPYVPRIQYRVMPPEGWWFEDDDGLQVICPKGHRGKILGDRVICDQCGAVGELTRERLPPNYHSEG